MTTSMIITLAVVILMIVVIMSDKLPFGAPALLAAVLLVLLGQTDIATAFSGFTDKNVVMVMGFMVATAALQKTKVIYNLKKLLVKVAKKGGVAGLALLVFVIMLGANFISGTAYYVLIITLVAQIPYNEKLPTSKIVMPAAFATYAGGWLPSGAAFYAGVIASLCESAGYTGTAVSTNKMVVINIIFSVFYLVYAIVMHKFLPDRDINDSLSKEADENILEEEFVPTLTAAQQTITYLLYVVMIIGMMFLSKLPGEIGYAIPLAVSGVLLVTGVLNFKEFSGNMFSPVMIMMASIIGVAAVMSECGLSAYLGELVAGMLGADPSLFLLVLIFATLTSLMATFTGASFGSLFVFAPIGISLCMNYGYNPIPLAYACTVCAWVNWFMPIDGMPALVMGVGKYKLTEFWLYTIPLWIVKMLLICGFGTFFLA